MWHQSACLRKLYQTEIGPLYLGIVDQADLRLPRLHGKRQAPGLKHLEAGAHGRGFGGSHQHHFWLDAGVVEHRQVEPQIESLLDLEELGVDLTQGQISLERQVLEIAGQTPAQVGEPIFCHGVCRLNQFLVLVEEEQVFDQLVRRGELVDAVDAFLTQRSQVGVAL